MKTLHREVCALTRANKTCRHVAVLEDIMCLKPHLGSTLFTYTDADCTLCPFNPYLCRFSESLWILKIKGSTATNGGLQCRQKFNQNKHRTRQTFEKWQTSGSTGNYGHRHMDARSFTTGWRRFTTALIRTITSWTRHGRRGVERCPAGEKQQVVLPSVFKCLCVFMCWCSLFVHQPARDCSWK